MGSTAWQGFTKHYDHGILRRVCSLELTVRAQPTNSGSDWFAVARVCSCGPCRPCSGNAFFAKRPDPAQPNQLRAANDRGSRLLVCDRDVVGQKAHPTSTFAAFESRSGLVEDTYCTDAATLHLVYWQGCLQLARRRARCVRYYSVAGTGAHDVIHRDSIRPNQN